MEATETTSNGASNTTTVKPWIAAGFKSREEYRASRRPAKAAVEAKPAKVKPAKAKTLAAKTTSKPKAKKKTKAKMKTAGKGKATKRKKPAAPMKGMVRDASLAPLPLAELGPNAKKVFLAVKLGKTMTLAQIEKKAFPNVPHARASSRVRNQLRVLRVHKMFKLLGEGQYKRIS